MEKLHKFSDNLYGNDFNDLNTYLHECNAYEDPQSAKLIYIDRIFNIKTDNDLTNVPED
jgi:hypothetical protein